MQNYQDFCQAITAKLFNLIEQGSLLSWHKNWKKNICAQLPVGANGIYHGANLFGLLYDQFVDGFNSNQWFTFNQIKKKGGQVKKGAKGKIVYFWQIQNVSDKESKDGKPKKIPFFKTYCVFNLEQTTLEPVSATAPTLQLNTIDELIHRLGITVSHFGGKAFYKSSDDCIVLPSPENFNTQENYFATLLHELCHATGAKERVPRPCFDNYGESVAARAEEELIAEIGSVFLCAHFGIKGELENHASYIKHWKQELNEKQIMSAVNKAAKVFEWLLKQSQESAVQ